MKGSENRHLLQDIFSSKAEYQKYLKSAYSFLRGLRKGVSSSIIPVHLEIKLSSKIKNQRLSMDKKKYSTLIIELPIKKNISPRKKGSIKSKALVTYAPVLGIYEKALADDFAITEKLLDMN